MPTAQQIVQTGQITSAMTSVVAFVVLAIWTIRSPGRRALSVPAGLLLLHYFAYYAFVFVLSVTDPYRNITLNVWSVVLRVNELATLLTYLLFAYDHRKRDR